MGNAYYWQMMPKAFSSKPYLSWVICCICLAGHPSLMLMAQNPYPSGGYRNLEEIRERQPSVGIHFEPRLRSPKEIKMFGGNDFQMEGIGEGIDNKFVAEEIFAICSGNSLYLNTLPHKLTTGYALVLNEGRYLAFRTGFRDKKKKHMAGSMVTFVPGANVIGMSTTMLAMLAKAKSSERYLLVLDTETSLLYLMDRNFILSLVSSHPSIEYEYTLETEQNNEVTLLKYLQMVNAATGN